MYDYDVFGIWRLMRWVQIAFAVLAAIGMLAALAGFATGRFHREPVVRDTHAGGAARVAAASSSRPVHTTPAHHPSREAR